MDNFKAFEGVMDYLEGIATGSEEVDYGLVSKLAGSPAPLFQRIFVYITGVTISEYVRRRRLTIAGYALLRGEAKVIDLALEYGFQSHSSFTRAFKEHHGFSPSMVRKGHVKLKDYPRISFTNMRLVGGKIMVAEMKKIEYVQWDARKVVGMMKNTAFDRAGEECWGTAVKEGLFDTLQELEEWFTPDMDDYFGLGYMSQFSDNMHFQYIVGRFVDPDAPVPDTLYAKDIPSGMVAKIWIEADNLNDIISCAYFLCTEAIEKTGYQVDYDSFYWCDVYTRDRYILPLEKGEKIILDYFLPVKKG